MNICKMGWSQKCDCPGLVPFICDHTGSNNKTWLDTALAFLHIHSQGLPAGPDKNPSKQQRVTAADYRTDSHLMPINPAAVDCNAPTASAGYAYSCALGYHWRLQCCASNSCDIKAVGCEPAANQTCSFLHFLAFLVIVMTTLLGCTLIDLIVWALDLPETIVSAVCCASLLCIVQQYSYIISASLHNRQQTDTGRDSTVCAPVGCWAQRACCCMITDVP